MIIRVKVQTHAHEDKIEEMGVDEYKIWTTAIPEKGNANEAVIDIVSDFFDVAPSLIRIRSGHKSTHKLIEVGWALLPEVFGRKTEPKGSKQEDGMKQVFNAASGQFQILLPGGRFSKPFGDVHQGMDVLLGAALSSKQLRDQYPDYRHMVLAIFEPPKPNQPHQS